MGKSGNLLGGWGVFIVGVLGMRGVVSGVVGWIGA